MCETVHSWRWRVACGFLKEKGAEGATFQLEVGTWFFLYHMCSLGAYNWISVLGAMLILHKLK